MKEKPEDVRYIKIRPEAAGVLAKDSIPNFAIIGNWIRESVGGGGGGEIPASQHLQPLINIEAGLLVLSVAQGWTKQTPMLIHGRYNYYCAYQWTAMWDQLAQ